MVSRNILIFIFLLVFSSLARAQAPVANFTANVTEGCGTLVVTFTDQSTNTPTSWQWSFGDGGTSTQQNPTWAYNFPGTYNVTLKATNGSGNNTITRNAYIKVYHLPSPDFSGTPLAGCAPLAVQFTNSSSQGDFPITSYHWDFGDGMSSTAQNPNHIYNSAGVFQVTLSVTDQKGCTEDMTKIGYVNVGVKPIANFTFSGNSGCDPPVHVTFSNTTIPTTCTYYWNFGDGGTSMLTNPTHNFNAPGNYTVTLIATSNGCPDTIVHVVNILTNQFNPSFAANPTMGCVPLTVNFTDMSPLGVNSWYWKFGDGSTGTTQNPTHTYTNPGAYTVRLITTNTSGCTDSITYTNYINVYAPPTVTFTGTPLFSCNPPLSVQFISTVPGAVAWQWNFGDSTSGSAQNPNHPYYSTGSFTVTLTVTDNHGCTATLTRPNYVLVDPTFASFSMTPPDGCRPLNVQFTDQTSTNSYVTSWSWNFGDGSPASNLSNPSHIYNNIGVYPVTLTITDSAGCSRTFVDTVKVGQKPTANFWTDDTIGCHPLEVNFHDSSSSFANSWEWTFGDGGTSDEQDPTHTYQDTGYFDVQLIVEHNGCGDTMIIEDYIYVKPPKPEFTATPTTGCHYPMTVQFTDQSILPQTWYWDFGDGSTSTQQNPSHTYLSPGFYNVMLRVTNANGCRDSLIKSQYIKISDIVPDFTQTATVICLDEASTFLSTTVCNTYAASWTWYFGDGTFATGFISTHTWTAPGVYSIKLVVTDALGCSDSITKVAHITVNALPHPDFTVNSVIGCVPMNAQFTSQATAVSPATIASWSWNFGDSTTSTSINPSHIYSQPGYYTVTLTVIDSKGCDSTIVMPAYIYVSQPAANFTVDSITCSGDTVFFTNQSSGVDLHYSWNFGDGSPASSAVDPYHIYNVGTTTTYTVTLTVTDTNNCVTAFTRNIVISKPVADFASNTLMANCPPLFVNFADSSSADVVGWDWNFGDPSSGTNNNSIISDPQHLFNTSGMFNVTLIVTNADGCTDTIYKPNFIIVNGPTGSFSFQPLSGCSPLDVNFIANAQSTTSYLWVFGDGNASNTTGNSTTHTYNGGGVFVPTLVLSDSIHNCQLTLISADTITVIAGLADFSFTACPPCTDSATIHFYDSSYCSQPLTGWLWNFGDGQTSTSQNPSHLYNTNGTFDVTLTVYSDSCSWTLTIPYVATIFIPPQVDFDIGNTSTCVPPLVTRYTIDTATLTYQATAYDWDFGDGSPHSGAFSPVHSYSSTGLYDVTVVITFANGCQHTYTKSFNLYIYPIPTAEFHSDTNNVLSGWPINFINTSSGVSITYSWSFGDGNTSTEENPVHTYYESGDFPVFLIVKTPNGCSDTAELLMHIIEDLIIPNVFTPNGDGVNDVFRIMSSGFPDYTLLIYNRWGKLIYKNNDPFVYWDGTIDKKPAADGTYYFVLKVSNSFKSKSYTGTVTLLR